MKVTNDTVARAPRLRSKRAFASTSAGGPLFTDFVDNVAAAAGSEVAAALMVTPLDPTIDNRDRAKPNDSSARDLRRGRALLDHLDDIRLGLLLGTIPHAKLRALAASLQMARGALADPKLAPVLDEIDLRARVELAKLTREA